MSSVNAIDHAIDTVIAFLETLLCQHCQLLFCNFNAVHDYLEDYDSIINSNWLTASSACIVPHGCSLSRKTLQLTPPPLPPPPPPHPLYLPAKGP